jgi:tRNA pseudouridine32 synthase/23S rRNA pseudouridine746 synthase
VVTVGIEVRYADDALLVLNKPAGLLSVPGKGPALADCLSARAQVAYPDARVVHRLDMSTSGLLVMAIGLDAQRALNRQFAQREVHKRYEAVVTGTPDEHEADPDGWSDIRLPLMVDWPNRPRSKVDHPLGKPSHTRWRRHPRASPLSGTTRLELKPITGRSHQLRVHLQAIGHPIVGDELYAPPAVADQAARLFLHARELALHHPRSGQWLTFCEPAPF